MSAPAPFTYQATLSYPPDVGAPNVAIPIAMSDTFESNAVFTYKLVGAGTQVVDLGTIAPEGCKLLSIEVDADVSPAAAAVMAQFNASGATGQIELSPGGFLTIGSPKPTTLGVTALTLVHTTDVCVRVRILG